MFKFVVKRNCKELFHRAVAENDVLRVRMLLDDCREDTKFNIDEINEDGLTALQNSCFIGNIEMVKLLVSYGGNLKIKDRDGWSLLHAAVMAGNFNLVQFLVESGLNICSKTDTQDMPIDFAEDKEILIYLVKKMIAAGLIGEVQSFIRRKPRYKKEIYKQIELSIQSKRDEIKALESFPITPREKKGKQMKGVKVGKKVVDSNRNNLHQKHDHSTQIENPAKKGREFKPKVEKGHLLEIFTVDVDNLPETPAHKKWSSMTNLNGSLGTDFIESKIKMHNGYETDGANNFFPVPHGNRRDLQNGQDGVYIPKSEHQEVDIVSVNSHSTSGYETDDNPLMYITRGISYQNNREVVKRVENNNEIESSYFQRSQTMSPRTMRRLEHRFGHFVFNNANEANHDGSNMAPEETYKRIEFPEIFL